MTDGTETKVLNQAELQSAVWAKLRAHMQDRLQALRIKNDTDLDPVATAAVRGAIKNLKYLLALETKPNQATVADEEPGE